MPFYEVSNERLDRLPLVSLATANIHERRDLQRMLRKQLTEIAPDILVIAEEFGDWDDSKRRIDLLGLDEKANLVVIELKRGETGHHMDLQAIRYASMVSTMTFEQAVTAYELFLGIEEAHEARSRMLSFLKWSEPKEDDFAQDVRILLFSENYSLELTGSILWLRDKGLDISCFRMSGYKLGERLLIDFSQIIPLQGAEDFQIKVRNKQQVEREARRERVEWNGEYYANYGNDASRSWEDACKYGFISAGGGTWFSRTLNLLVPGARVWVNRPGVGYLGVGIVEGHPVPATEFNVSTSDGSRRYIDMDSVTPAIKAHASDPSTMEFFVPIRWLAKVTEAKAIREAGLFGNQNSVAKPTAELWPHTVDRLRKAFGIPD